MKTRSKQFDYRFSKFCLALLFPFYCQSSFAQQANVSSGGNATGSGGSVSYSVGQVFFSGNSGTGGSVSQGVQQSFNNAALPVTLVAFEAIPVTVENGQQVLVRWETTSETNNDFFTVERSVNGTKFAELIRVNTAGNSKERKKYSWADPLPFPGVSYYRLKQTDLDQTFAYSTLRAVRIDNPAKTMAYPNPVHSYLHLRAIKNEIRSYQIFDLSGRLVEDSKLAKGENEINMSRFSPAAYLIRIVADSEINQFKILKN